MTIRFSAIAAYRRLSTSRRESRDADSAAAFSPSRPLRPCGSLGSNSRRDSRCNGQPVCPHSAGFSPLGSYWCVQSLSAFLGIALFFVVFVFAGRLVADDLEPRLKHPWGACRPGATKEVRVVSENLDASGQVISRSTTVTRTTLQEVTARDYALAVKVCVDVGGKKFDSPPQLVRQGFYGEFPGEAVTLRKLRDETIAFQGRNMAVETREITISGERQRRVMSIACSRAAYPFQFRCSANTFSGDGKTPLATTQVEVVATEIPYRVLGEIRDVAFVRTTQTHPKGTRTITLEVHCPDVPGGVVAHMSKEMDERGQTLRRSELELVAFDAGPVPANPRVLGATTEGEATGSFAAKESASDEATSRRPLRTRRREPAVADRSPRR